MYNVEKYLKICVDSILAQTYEKYELILINDGATNKSGLQDKIAQLKEKLVLVDDSERALTDKYAGLMRSEYSIWGSLVK